MSQYITLYFSGDEFAVDKIYKPMFFINTNLIKDKKIAKFIDDIDELGIDCQINKNKIDERKVDITIEVLGVGYSEFPVMFKVDSKNGFDYKQLSEFIEMAYSSIE